MRLNGGLARSQMAAGNSYFLGINTNLKMRREWAIRSGVNPVCYYFQNTPFMAGVRKIIEKAAEENKQAIEANDMEAQFTPFLK